MFLDPEPRKPRQTMAPGVFSPPRNTSTESPRDTHRTAIKRKPLHERSQSQNNRRPPSAVDIALDKPTVRLVQRSSPTSSRENSDSQDSGSGNSKGEGHDAGRAGEEDLSTVVVVTDAEILGEGVIRTWPTGSVSGLANTIERRTSSGPRSAVWAPPTIAQFDPPRPQWHRRSYSSGIISNSSTLYLQSGPDGSAVSGLRKSVEERRQSHASLETTLRGTPTPFDVGLDRSETEDISIAGSSLFPPLQSLPDTSPERTISPEMESPIIKETREDLWSQSFQPSHSQIQAQREEESAASSEASRSRSSSGSSLPVGRNTPGFEPSSSPPTREDLRYLPSGGESPSASSPNFVIYRQMDEVSASDGSDADESLASTPNYKSYSSPVSQKKSRGRRLRAEPSFDSIDSRLKYPSASTHGRAGNALENRVIQPTSSTDTLPAIHIPKKTLSHRAAASPLRPELAHGEAPTIGQDGEEIDTLPYPRQAFSTHLSTIASESDRAASQHWSHFSMGSGVLTGDDSSSLLPSAVWSSRMSGSPTPVWIPPVPGSHGLPADEDSEDMTLNIYREESAKPPPLFKSHQKSGQLAGPSRQYEGLAPQIPPVPWYGENEEDWDQVPELAHPRLHSMRSGQSLRQRSNSTPSLNNSRHMSFVSIQSSERPGSSGSGLFPYWAKQYYGHGVNLMSPSNVSLVMSPQSRPTVELLRHGRGESDWTDITTTSRFGASYDDLGTDSPASSRFLPSIFRPRTRVRLNRADNSSQNSRFLRSKSSQRSQPSSNQLDTQPETIFQDRPDSMVIYPNPLPHNHFKEAVVAETSSQIDMAYIRQVSPSNCSSIIEAGLPQPRSPQTIDRLDDHPLPNLPSQQSPWTSRALPAHGPRASRSSSTSALPQGVIVVPHAYFNLQSTPHLHTTKRSAAQGLSTWQAPSFVESLDTLVHSGGNRQILLFVIGFLFPPFWILGAFLPIPRAPTEADFAPPVLSASPSFVGRFASVDDVVAGNGEKYGDAPHPRPQHHLSQPHTAAEQTAMIQMLQNQADYESQRARWSAERVHLKAQWWRALNRVMSVLGVAVIGAIIALAVVATSR